MTVTERRPRLFRQGVFLEAYPKRSKEADLSDYTFITDDQDDVETKVVERANRPSRPKPTATAETKRRGRRPSAPKQR